MEQQLLEYQNILIMEAAVSRSDTPHSVTLLWTSDQQTPLLDDTQHSQEVPKGVE